MAKKKSRKVAKEVNVTPILTLALQHHQAGRVAEAEGIYRQILQQYPHHRETHHFLGVALYQLGKLEEAISHYRKALGRKPNYPDAHLNLGNALVAVGKIEEAINHYQQALALNPKDGDIYNNLGNALIKLGKFDEATKYYKQAISLNPNYGEAYNNLGNIYSVQLQLDEAIDCYRKAIQINPNYQIALNNLGKALEEKEKLDRATSSLKMAWEKLDEMSVYSSEVAQVNQDLDLIQFSRIDELLYTQDFQAARQVADEYIKLRGEDKILPLVASISAYLKSGLNEVARTKFIKLENLIYNNLESLNKTEKGILYKRIGFCLSYLRDDLQANSKLSKILAQKYLETISDLTYHSSSRSRSQISDSAKNRKLKIGILSSYFKRSSVGWVSLAFIKELSKITPDIFLYSTGEFKKDDLTQKFTEIATKFYCPNIRENNQQDSEELIQQIQQDELDILISMDSLTVPLQVQILQAKPALICITWAGFDAPFTSAENYFLCDRHTHPQGRESFYREQLIRMPNSHLVTAGFQTVNSDRNFLRKSSQIPDDKLAFLCLAHGMKFNRDLVKAQIQILKNVPNSLLLYKGRGDARIIQETYQQECASQGIDFQRIKFLGQTKTEEEHRTIYILADVLLDSYPYNGGVHTLEALWFNLPIVTRKGEQFASRLGYSCLKTLGIEAGIATNWDEYIYWGIKLGQDGSLRQKIRDLFRQSQQPETLSPLWNPRQYAEDMYQLLEGLLR
jgi:predicted O-linked N-acetylglucosamine transferase (SPINDLY family)